MAMLLVILHGILRTRILTAVYHASPFDRNLARRCTYGDETESTVSWFL